MVDTTPVVEGDWLSDKDIATWLTNKLYHNEVSEPRAWTCYLGNPQCGEKITRGYITPTILGVLNVGTKPELAT